MGISKEIHRRHIKMWSNSLKKAKAGKSKAKRSGKSTDYWDKEIARSETYLKEARIALRNAK